MTIEVLLSGDELILRLDEGISSFICAANRHETLPENKKSFRYWGRYPNATIAHALRDIFLVLKENRKSELPSWLLALGCYNQLPSKSVKKKTEIDKILMATGVELGCANFTNWGSCARKVVGFLLFTLAKYKIIRLPVDFMFPRSSHGVTDYCASSWPLIFRVAKAMYYIGFSDTKLYDVYDLLLDAKGLPESLTRDDKAKIPSYVMRAFIVLEIFTIDDLELDMLRALHQWHLRYGVTQFWYIKKYASILAAELIKREMYVEAKRIKQLTDTLMQEVNDELFKKIEQRYDGSRGILKKEKVTCCPVNGKSHRFIRKNKSKVEINPLYYGVVEKVSLADAGPYKLIGKEFLYKQQLTRNEMVWPNLQVEFLKHANYESEKLWVNSFSYLNKYLFGYLRIWFEKNQKARFPFPAVPNDFKSAFYVFPVRINLTEPYPETLPHFVKAHSIGAVSAQAVLRNLVNFFEWITIYANNVDGCDKFKIPMSYMDLPKATKPTKTNKGKIPKRYFTLFMNYMYAIHEWMVVEHNAIKDGYKENHLSLSKKQTLDWFDEEVFCPLVAIEQNNRTKLVPINAMPNIFMYQYFPNINGKNIKMLNPGPFVQLLAALETGQRHQNIQWLDRLTYHMFFNEDLEAGYEGVRLFVNTDKVKEEPFIIVVHRRIVDVFGLQEIFFENIDKTWFRSFYYEGNKDSKWGRINCLFQSTVKGYPHSDVRYLRMWYGLLQSFQMFIFEYLRDQYDCICSLLPSEVAFGEVDFYIENDDPRVVSIWESVNEEEENSRSFVFVTPKSFLSPHSTRSTVVSNALSYLPAEFIGKNITGQTPAVVYYYGVIDQEDRDELLRRYHKQLNFAVPAEEGAEVNIVAPNADAEDSPLRAAMEMDVEKALMDFGCISLTAHLENNDKAGIELAKTTDVKGFNFGDKRICPLNGYCPKDIIVEYGLNNCAECYYAIFSVDHLPPISAEVRRLLDDLYDLTDKLRDETFVSRLTLNKTNELNENKLDVARRIGAWQTIARQLELNREHLIKHNTFLVGRPDLVMDKIVKIDGEHSPAQGILLRMQEAIAYPLATSSRYKARIKKLSRKLLIHLKKMDEYEYLLDKEDPSRELYALINTIAGYYDVTPDQIVATLQDPEYILKLGEPPKGNLLIEDTTHG